MQKYLSLPPITSKSILMAFQLMQKNMMIKLSTSDNKACMLCNKKKIDEKLYGLLYRLNDIIVHHYCLLLSSTAKNGQDHEGILGFLLNDIKAVIIRGSKETCVYCNKKGATISCSGSACKKIFHLPCGLRNFSMHQYFKHFKSFCYKHRVNQYPNLPIQPQLQHYTSTTCTICKNDVPPFPSPTSIWPPCCKNNYWFHRDCVQDLALSAGYDFKCPLCNDVRIFKNEMLHIGIFIPSRDASSETAPNAYVELNERNIMCNAETCACPNVQTRKYHNEFGPWRLITCCACGSNGTHTFCSSVDSEEWYCRICLSVADNLRTNKIKLEHDNGICSGISVMFEKSVSAQNKEVFQCAQYKSSDDLIPVLDSNISSVQCLTYTKDLNTHLQLDQTPQMQLPIIASYSSLSTGQTVNCLTDEFPVSTNNLTSFILISDDDDDVQNNM